jgi:hypothetical protein
MGGGADRPPWPPGPQWAQQKKRPVDLGPVADGLHPQCSHTGAIRWMAHFEAVEHVALAGSAVTSMALS